ncbi:MAG: hypothetical protein ACPL28_04700 [bacterium]
MTRRVFRPGRVYGKKGNLRNTAFKSKIIHLHNSKSKILNPKQVWKNSLKVRVGMLVNQIINPKPNNQ